ncbi:hypothetical protein PSACC_02549 [Paramicrosporidium saccamoebae]|uniref:Uncharacterized protein n=1 Tax=Paramicrosporidium saccamoebae TaxID=1246581 RepID=A0A2H9TIR5_9FUNG|nr:hypothetical protein PSACC_02549 [Paramicrosporidium saccamoebae]
MLDPRLRALLVLSLLGNVVLVVFYYTFSVPALHAVQKGLNCWDLEAQKADYYLDVNMMSLPMYRPQSSELNVKRARLTNLVMPFHARQEPAVMRNLELWKHFPPCYLAEEPGTHPNQDYMDSFFARDEHPAGRLGRNVTLTFFVSSEADPELEMRVLGAFNALPIRIQKCFSSANVRFSRLSNEDDKYLTGSRKMFEYMLNGWLGLLEPYYALYMEPDCLPVRPNWLMILDSQTRWPNSPFWIKGSIFRGDAHAITNRIVYNLFHINGNALYNLGDPSFRHFYFDMLRPYITKYYTEGAYDTDVFKFLLDLGNYNYARQTAHMFQFTDAIQNHWHSNYSIGELKAMSETVVLVHGGTPNP